MGTVSGLVKKTTATFRHAGIVGVGRAAWRKWFPVPSPVAIALRACAEGNGFTIVQLGAHVGNTGNDPLFQWIRVQLAAGRGRLICVEPDAEHFKALVENYRDTPNVSFENSAIADRSGHATFYRLGVDPVAHGFPAWLSQLGSLKKERMESLWDRYENMAEAKAFYLAHRVEDTVQCLTFADFLGKHHIGALDLLQMDVEGFELEILKTIDFGHTPIRFVNYENVLLQESKPEAEALVRQGGYEIFDYKQDTFCYKAADRALFGAFRP